MTSCRLAGSSRFLLFVNRNVAFVMPSFESSWRITLSLCCRTKIQQRQHKNINHYNAFCHLNSLSSLSLSFIQQPRSHIQPWIILTFHFHNSLCCYFSSQQDLRVKLEHEREKRYVGTSVLFFLLLCPSLNSSVRIFFVMLCHAWDFVSGGNHSYMPE